jgi:3-oxoacyl-[acyl-carrier protein] reductase
MDLGIAGRKAIINGGSAGMGKGSARALAKEGVDIWLVARGEERLHAAAAEIARETNARVTPVVADHSTVAGRGRILDACPEPDILVMTCAPPAQTGDYRSVSVDDWNDTFATTLLSPIEMMRATIDGMVERKFGRIVNIATGAAKYPAEIRLLSGAPRAPLVKYTVNNLLPGMFHTATIHDRMTERAKENGTSYDEEVQKFVRDWRIPAGKFGDPDDLGAFCAMFCSKYASFTVGQSLVIDGGLINSTF